jgi:hypothetical protein
MIKKGFGFWVPNREIWNTGKIEDCNSRVFFQFWPDVGSKFKGPLEVRGIHVEEI